MSNVGEECPRTLGHRDLQSTLVLVRSQISAFFFVECGLIEAVE